MLAHYASRLGAVELNGSFYRTPDEAAFRTWAEAPERFRFCLKAHRALTYSADGFDRTGVARQVTQRYAELGARLGPVLLQFPPARKRDPELLRSLLEALDRPVAAEFRDPSWFDADVEEVLREHGAAMVVTDDESWPRAPAGDYAFSYLRLRRDYSDAELRAWARRVPRDRDAYVFFKHAVAGPLRAEKLYAMVKPPLTDSV
jgi:uncharacterized protein YecE (DUF72 family)